MYYKLNAASEEAKELLTQKLCETFICHNWGPHNSNNEAESEITVYGDRLFSVPESILPDVLPWIMQYRISRLNSPAEINLDIAIHPKTKKCTLQSIDCDDFDYDYALLKLDRPYDMSKYTNIQLRLNKVGENKNKDGIACYKIRKGNNVLNGIYITLSLVTHTFSIAL